MARKKYTTEQIIVKLREIEVLCGQGKTIGEAVRQADISEQTYYRWSGLPPIFVPSTELVEEAS